MLAHSLLLWLFVFPAFGSTYEVRKRRSIAPFLGAGGPKPAGMMIQPELWQCGSNEVLRALSYNAVAQDCPSLAAALNHCCAIHDDCYGQQKGQKKCDDEYCECNKMVTRLPTEEGRKCKAYAKETCDILPLFGFFASNNSGYGDEGVSAGVQLVVPMNGGSLDKKYLETYSMCPFVNITLASCAINFDLCSDVHSPDFCSNDLCHCLLDAADSDELHAPNCTNAAELTCRYALHYSSVSMAAHKDIILYIKISIVILCILTVIGVGMFFWFKSRNSVLSGEGEYHKMRTVESGKVKHPLLANKK